MTEMTPELLAAISERDALAIPRFLTPQMSYAEHQQLQAEMDRRALLKYVGVLQGHLGHAFSLYLDALMDMRLEGGDRVLEVVFEMNPELRKRLAKMLSQPGTRWRGTE